MCGDGGHLPGDGRNCAGIVISCAALVSRRKAKYRLRLNCAAMVLIERRR